MNEEVEFGGDAAQTGLNQPVGSQRDTKWFQRLGSSCGRLDQTGVCVRVPGEVHGGVRLRLMRPQCVVDVLQVFKIRKFRYPTG